MTPKSSFIPNAVFCVALVAGSCLHTEASASDAGAFLGGVLATKVVGNMRDRTEAEQEQAYYAQQSAAQPVAPAPQQQSAEQRIQELDKLAAGGYITPDEYKTKKKAILDSM